MIPIIPSRVDALHAVSAWFCGSPQSEFKNYFYQVLQMNKSLVLIAVIAAAALVACGKKEEAPAPVVAPAPVEAPAAAAAVVDAAASAAEAATVAADAVAASASAAAEAADKAVDAAAEAAKAAASN